MATLAVLWAGGFIGGIASGAAGFAFGVAASAIWLHAIAPIHVAVLVVGGGLAMQSDHDLDAAPFARCAASRAVPGGGARWRSSRRLAPGAHRHRLAQSRARRVPLRLWRLCAGRAAAALCSAEPPAPKWRSDLFRASWAASAAIPACCRRSGPSFAAGRSTRRAPSISRSSSPFTSRPSPRSAPWRSTARGLCCWCWRCRRWRSALGLAGNSTAGSTRSASARRWRSCCWLSGAILVF